MSAASVYVYGPAGCGKSRNAERLRKKFDLDRVIDDYDNSTNRAPSVPKTGVLVIGQAKHGGPNGVRVVQYYQAIGLAGVAL